MTVQDHQRVSDEVRKLLNETYDEKLKRGGTTVATKSAKDAYEKASILPAAWSHWRQLAAYRLAHLLLRSDGSLQEIDELLSIAEGADFLEPLRSFCHLAVLHRIRSGMKNSKDLASVADRIEKVFATAKGHVKQAASPHDHSTVVRYIAQEPSFNTLEVLSYAMGLPYELEGIARNDDFLPYSDDHPTQGFNTHAWQILSQGFESVWMTEEFARREFASRISDGECIAIELAPNTSLNEKSNWAFQPNEVSDWISVPQNSDRLIETLLQNSASSMAELRKKAGVANYEDPGKRLRDVKSDTRKGVRQLASKPHLKVFEDRKGSDMYDLTEEIPFIVLKKHQRPKTPR